jgi:uncharacterized protein (TIGR02118 family)
MFCATVLYPFNSDESFDHTRYAVLAQRYADILGENCVGFEIRRGLNSPGESEAKFVCLASFWIKSAEAFGAVMHSPEMKNLMSEIATFTHIVPIRQFDDVLVSRK